MIQQDVPEKWVYWKLTSDPRTAAHFGFRVYPIIAPQGATRSDSGGVLTFAVFKRQSATWDTTTIDSDASANTIASSVAVDVYAETYALAREAANAVTAVLRGATGFQFGSMLISSLPTSEQDDIVVPVDGKGLPIYAVGQVYEIRVTQ